MLIPTVFKWSRTSGKLDYMVRNAVRLPSLDFWRLASSGDKRMGKKKEFQRPNRIIDRCPPKHAAFMEPRGKVAIITGGTTGIGLAVAYELLHAGACTVICSDNACDDKQEGVRFLKDKFGKGRALYFPSDVTSDHDIHNLFRYCLGRYRRVDILFNNAGIWNDREWERCLDTNACGALRGTAAAMEYMGRSGVGGLVVNCASTLAFDVVPSSPAFCASQHAIVAASECLGARFHLERTRVRVLSLCPGITHTSMCIGALARRKEARLAADTKKWMRAQVVQDTYSVARAFLYLVNYGLSGRHYVVEGTRMSEMKLPPKRTFAVPVCYYKKKKLFGLL